MRNLKLNSIIDTMYLTQISTDNYSEKKSSSTLIINGIDYNILNKKSNINLFLNEYEFFISINPMRHIGITKLKELLHIAYSRYCRYINGKKYRQCEKPVKLDFVIEEADDDIKFNHIHIMTNTKLSIINFQKFIGNLIAFFQEEIPSINFYSENITDKSGVLTYMLKHHIVEGDGHKKVISSDIKLMNETYL